MKHPRLLIIMALAILSGLVVSAFWPQPSQAAYHHMGEMDSDAFLSVHPDVAGSKLDSCSLCHSGGEMPIGGKPTSVGSCQWCHFSYGYDAKGDIAGTLNSYGQDYLAMGRSAQAVQAIETKDSDADGYSNGEEIAAIRYPGDAGDDPTKVPAPYRVFTREELEALPQQTQFMLMNAHKSDDYYAQYSGVVMEDLLRPMVLDSASGINVFSPDGFSQYHPLNEDAGFYEVYGSYPAATYFYDDQADMAKNGDGWVDYSSPSNAGMQAGDAITNPLPMKLLLALKRDGGYLATGVLNPQNKLDGEGPFRIVPPQKIPGPPDQRSTAKNQAVTWPFDEKADHNAGYSTRSATIIRVEPLPEGTTDVDLLEAGWGYVDEAKIMVYGAIDPTPTILSNLDLMVATVAEVGETQFVQAGGKAALLSALRDVRRMAASGDRTGALGRLDADVTGNLAGECLRTKVGVQGSWMGDCSAQTKLYWMASDVSALLKIAA